MSSPHLCALEFVGGPFDGYKHVVSYPPEDLAAMVALPVNMNIFLMLEGKRRGRKSPATSVAVYELQDRDGFWRYQYLGATPAKRFQLEGWLG